MDGMIMAYVIDVTNADGVNIGLYGREQAYLYKDVSSAQEKAKRLELQGYIAKVKAAAMFLADYD